MAIIDLTLSKLTSSPELTDPLIKAQVKEIQDNVDRMSDILRKLLNLRDEMYNEGLRGLKLFAAPDKGFSVKNQKLINRKWKHERPLHFAAAGIFVLRSTSIIEDTWSRSCVRPLSRSGLSLSPPVEFRR